jgi:leucyl/phenylalanyl-tRNA--protein transferase
MGHEGDGVEWYSPDPRGIIPLDTFHLSSRLARTLRRGSFDVRVDTAFHATIRACADRGETWITPLIMASYERLFELGYAHSVETWRDDVLVGGLYGVSLGGAFFGESMFHIATDASKVALCALVERLRLRGYRLLDVQWTTDHLVQFGAVDVPRPDYLELLAGALVEGCSFS